MEENSNEQKVETPNWESIAKYKAAELDNYIRRQKDAVQNAYNDGRINVIMKFLPITDALGEAIKMVKDENDKMGIKILIRKFEAILTDLGMEEIEVKIGDTFDPYIHSSIGASEDGSNKIKSVYQKGYKFAGRVIRPAMVQI